MSPKAPVAALVTVMAASAAPAAACELDGMFGPVGAHRYLPFQHMAQVQPPSPTPPAQAERDRSRSEGPSRQSESDGAREAEARAGVQSRDRDESPAGGR